MNAKRRTVAKRRNDRIALVVQIYYHISYPEAGNVFGDIADEWFAKKGNRRFSTVDGQRE
jgi:hypothetical protein